jgi:hypothetical protein
MRGAGTMRNFLGWIYLGFAFSVTWLLFCYPDAVTHTAVTLGFYFITFYVLINIPKRRRK